MIHIVDNITVTITDNTSVTPLGTFKHIMLMKNDKSNITWEEKQRVKNQIFGTDSFAVEIFPPECQLIDVVNAYHLWVVESTTTCPIGWNSGRQVLPDGRQAKV